MSACFSARSVPVQGQVHVAVQKLLAANAGEVGSITTTGHSLGGALASMCAFDIAWSGINKDGDQQWGDYIPVTAFTFEAPRVGGSSICPNFFSNGCATVIWNRPATGRPGSQLCRRVGCPGASRCYCCTDNDFTCVFQACRRCRRAHQLVQHFTTVHQGFGEA